MAKAIFTKKLSNDIEKSEYEAWVPGTTLKNIPIEYLHEWPNNWDLVGRIDGTTKAALKEDIKKNGIREPLEVIFRDGKLFLVSGHERRAIAEELGIETLPCIKKDLIKESEINQYIFAVNKHRKNVSLPTHKELELLFPMKEYPELYKDLRSNYAYDAVGEPAGKSENGAPVFTPEQTAEAAKIRQEERERQRNIVNAAAQKTGKQPKTIIEAKQKIAKKEKQKSEPKETVSKKQDPKTRLREINLELKTANAELNKLKKKIDALEAEKRKLS